MTLWAKTDAADTADTTINVTTTSASKVLTSVADTSAIFVGDQVTGTGIQAGSTVQSKVLNTSVTLNRAATASATVTGTFVHKNVSKPKFQTVAEQKLTFGVDVNEIQVTPATHTGWVKVTEFSSGRAGRKHYETIVAMGSMGLNAGGTAVTSDAEDVAFPDPVITISAQPTALTAVNYTAVTNLAPVTLGVTVSAAAAGKVTLTYQWKTSATSAGSYVDVVNVAGVTGIAGATTNTLVLKSKIQDTKFYKLAITATPAVGSPLTALSNAAKVAGGVLVTAGSWSTTATITAIGHGLISTDTAVVSGVTPAGYNTAGTGAVMTVAGDTLNYASADPTGVVIAPFTGLVYKYVA